MRTEYVVVSIILMIIVLLVVVGMLTGVIPSFEEFIEQIASRS